MTPQDKAARYANYFVALLLVVTISYNLPAIVQSFLDKPVTMTCLVVATSAVFILKGKYLDPIVKPWIVNTIGNSRLPGFVDTGVHTAETETDMDKVD